MLKTPIATADDVILRVSGPACNLCSSTEQELLAYVGQACVEVLSFRSQQTTTPSSGSLTSVPVFGESSMASYRIDIGVEMTITTGGTGSEGATTVTTSSSNTAAATAAARSRLRAISIAPKRVAKLTIALVFDSRVEIWSLSSKDSLGPELIFSYNFAATEVMVSFEWSNSAIKQAFVSSNKFLYTINFPSRKETSFGVLKEEAVSLERGLIVSSKVAPYSAFGGKHSLSIYRPDHTRRPNGDNRIKTSDMEEVYYRDILDPEEKLVSVVCDGDLLYVTSSTERVGTAILTSLSSGPAQTGFRNVLPGAPIEEVLSVSKSVFSAQLTTSISSSISSSSSSNSVSDASLFSLGSASSASGGGAGRSGIIDISSKSEQFPVIVGLTGAKSGLSVLDKLRNISCDQSTEAESFSSSSSSLSSSSSSSSSSSFLTGASQSASGVGAGGRRSHRIRQLLVPESGKPSLLSLVSWFECVDGNSGGDSGLYNPDVLSIEPDSGVCVVGSHHSNRIRLYKKQIGGHRGLTMVDAGYIDLPQANLCCKGLAFISSSHLVALACAKLPPKKLSLASSNLYNSYNCFLCVIDVDSVIRSGNSPSSDDGSSNTTHVGAAILTEALLFGDKGTSSLKSGGAVNSSNSSSSNSSSSSSSNSGSSSINGHKDGIAASLSSITDSIASLHKAMAAGFGEMQAALSAIDVRISKLETSGNL
jgi:trimeric autotransporter adhesin